jgi:hypothetical protein
VPHLVLKNLDGTNTVIEDVNVCVIGPGCDVGLGIGAVVGAVLIVVIGVTCICGLGARLMYLVILKVKNYVTHLVLLMMMHMVIHLTVHLAIVLGDGLSKSNTDALGVARVTLLGDALGNSL